ncbi:hypothetical protein KY342_00855, partial [Candidatus Woesearchaeota archaeon]|nr:hypothetical protein [Candidatus Woesearchaeota archaeon]
TPLYQCHKNQRFLGCQKALLFEHIASAQHYAPKNYFLSPSGFELFSTQFARVTPLPLRPRLIGGKGI